MAYHVCPRDEREAPTKVPERPEEIPDEPRCDCGVFFDSCSYPYCSFGGKLEDTE
jgi:hypothetical protein